MRPIPPESLVALLGRWSAGRGPLYLLLATRLRQLIADGELPDQHLLPPDRTLAAALAVGRGTVVAAYDVLRQEGRLVRTRGSGTRVCAEAPDPGTSGTATANPLFLHLLDRPGDGVLQLACAGPDALPPELVAAHHTALDHLSRMSSAGLGYHPAGVPELRTALAARYTAQGVPTTQDQILVTTGGQQALALLARLLVAPGDRVLTETPTYPGAVEVFRDAVAAIRTVRVAEHGLDVDAFAAAMTRERPALAYVTASFHNPTGTCVHTLARRRLARVAERSGTPLVDDEVLAPLGFTDQPPPIAAFATADEVVTIGSLSKLVWGGIRIGWVRAAPAMITRLARLKATHDLGGDVLAQLSAAHLLPQLDELRRRRVAALRERHDHLRGELARVLPEWEVTSAQGGQTLWVRLPGTDTESFAQTALRHGVAVVPGSAFDPGRGHREHVRIPYLADPATLGDAVERLASAWRQGAAVR
ncbi:aminotransferase-like domain-containing protein [Actinophytocola xanthii]|uniref:GntR family transcriptional regulator n=1 Tax=Actinophytocola xanthii TaxID=1912961 RepID=A0A1Q8CLD2_9PSEU|nr:PLP-dependent aminotransferase family protein [Actinophytocola xanthii]OLF15166.1 GntR family transcriptional regulator [Actinophytocola xanthii]